MPLFYTVQWTGLRPNQFNLNDDYQVRHLFISQVGNSEFSFDQINLNAIDHWEYARNLVQPREFNGGVRINEKDEFILNLDG